MSKIAESKRTAQSAKRTSKPFFQKGSDSALSQTEDNSTFFSNRPVDIQAKLTIGQPDDKYEHEADDLANNVVQAKTITEHPIDTKPNPSITIQAKCASCEKEELQKKEEKQTEEELPQLQEKEEEQTEEVLPELQKKVECETSDRLLTKSESLQVIPPALPSIATPSTVSSQHSSVQLKCDVCENEEIPDKEIPVEAEGVQKKLAIGAPNDPFEKEADAVADRVVQRLQLKPTLEESEESLQKSSCRECDEAYSVFRKPVVSSILQLTGDSTPKADGSRESIIAAAKTMLGKIQAKNDDGSGKRTGAQYLLEIFHLAAPGVWDDSIIETAGAAMPSWCGIFAVWAHKKAGKDIGNWQMGRGVSAFGTLSPTTTPQPGDIGYINDPNQHHCIVVKVEGDTVHSIDGNSGNFSEVIENTRPMSVYTAPKCGFFTAFGSSGTVQRKAESTGTASPDIESKINSTKSSGSSLPNNVKTHMESSMGADFSNVKIHTDSSAIQMSKDLHAQAFTHGSDIYFNSGKYDTGSTSGQHLLAHELTHTVQQGAVAQTTSVQRKENTTLVTSAPAKTGSTVTPATTTLSARFIVADTETPTTEQLTKTAFLARLNRETCTVVDKAFEGLPFTSAACPYITEAFQRLLSKTPLQIEKTLIRYEPLLNGADTISRFFEIYRERVRKAVNGWLQTGDLSGVPEEIASKIPESMRWTAGILGKIVGGVNNFVSGVKNVASSIGNAVSSGVSSVVSGIGSLFFKGKEGGAKANQSLVSVMAQLGKGQALNSATLSKMEGAMGGSFSGVEIHTDSNAAALSQSMNARAFTVGNHIAFANGEHQPGTLKGDALLAHELAHVQQQKVGLENGLMQKSDTAQNDSLEENADNQAVHAVSKILTGNRQQHVKLPEGKMKVAKTGLKLQRCGAPAGPEWDGDFSKLKIDLFTTTNLNEAPVDPGEAITRDFPSFVARLNYHDHPYPRVTSYQLIDIATGEDMVGYRKPSSGAVSRIPMPSRTGNFKVVGHMLTGYSSMPNYNIERPISIIEPLKTLAAAQAPADLAQQGKHTLQGDLLNFEQFSAIIRQNAVSVAKVPQELVDAWNTAHAQAIIIEGSINQTIGADLSKGGKTALRGFYGQLRTAVSGSDVYHPEKTETEHDGYTQLTTTTPAYTTNPYLSPDDNATNVAALNGGDAAADWRKYLDTFYRVTKSLNKYIADKLTAAGFADSAKQLTQAGAYANHLRKLNRDHPDSKPVNAVFYPYLQADLKNNAKKGDTPHYQLTGLPQKMYTYRTTNDSNQNVWHLIDMTRPDKEPLETSEVGGTATVPPRELITELDSAERFPEGIMHWQFDGGAADSCTMTHPWSASEVLNLISMVLAITGLMALVAASGGALAPVVPTVIFVASGLAGAAAAAAHIKESEELGTLTQQSLTADVFGIATGLLGAATAGLGHVVKAAQASEAAWTAWRGLAALGAQAVYRPIQVAQMAADFGSLVAFSSQAAEQYNAIAAMPEGEAKTTAMRRLVGMSLLTGGMTLISIRGGMHEIGSGKTLYLDFTTIKGVSTPVAYRVMPQADIIAHVRLGAAKSDAEAFLARTDLDAATFDRFRGELSVSLNTAGMADSEIQGFVQRIRKAATAAEASAILAEFRNNRVNISVGGVSRSAGYNLSYFHTSPEEFQTVVKKSFETPGSVIHNGSLVHPEGKPVSNYTMSVEVPGGGRAEADVVIVYSDFTQGSAIGTGTIAPGASLGPARNTVVWDATAKRWTVRIEVDQRLHPNDIPRAVGHELDEAGDVINRLNGKQGADINEQIAAMQKPGIFTGKITPHDVATLREIEKLLADAATNPQSGQSLSVILRDMGLTAGDRKAFQARLEAVMRSGHISEDKIVLLEAWSTYDTAVARDSRIKKMTRAEFIEEYKNGERFDEGGSDRWYKLDAEATVKRQFFTEAEFNDSNLAFNRLAGTGSTSSFKPYYDMMIGNGIVTETRVRTRLNQLLASTRGRDLDFVRHQLKATFRKDVIGYVTNKGRLTTAYPGKTFEEASHAEMLRVTAGLNSSDKGTLAEEWYAMVFTEKAVAHVQFVGVSGTTRYPDLLHLDGTLQDLKYIEGKLTAREIEQFGDYKGMIGKEIEITDATNNVIRIKVERLRYAFINPVGAEKNAAWMFDQVSKGGSLTFEIFNTKGQRRMINAAGVWDMNGAKVAEINFLKDTVQLKAWLGIP